MIKLIKIVLCYTLVGSFGCISRSIQFPLQNVVERRSLRFPTSSITCSLKFIESSAIQPFIVVWEPRSNKSGVLVVMDQLGGKRAVADVLSYEHMKIQAVWSFITDPFSRFEVDQFVGIIRVALTRLRADHRVRSLASRSLVGTVELSANCADRGGDSQ